MARPFQKLLLIALALVLLLGLAACTSDGELVESTQPPTLPGAAKSAPPQITGLYLNYALIK